MIINREWAMPNKNTFDIKPIRALIERYVGELDNKAVIVDPFANHNNIATITNDLDPSMPTDYHMDACDFLKQLADESVDLMLFDPPYSPRQISECYANLGLSVNMETTQSSYWSNLKIQIARVVKSGGRCITFSWNSGGIGKKHNFDIVEILLVAHGGWHNDTICTVETKIA